MTMSWLRHAFGRIWPTLLYATLCGVFLVALSDRAWQHVAVLNGDEWQPIQTFIRPHRRGEEPVCFLPSWTVGHATDQYKFRGIELLRSPSEAWAGRDEPEPGFWVVSQFDAFDEHSVPEQIYPHRGHVRIGQADVYVFRTTPFDLPDSLAFHVHEAACVLHGPGAVRLPLVWNRTGFDVPRGDPRERQLSYLGCRTTESRFGGRPHYGIWFHPPPQGQSLSITWPRVRVQPWLAVSGGLRDQIAGRKAVPTKLSVILDGRTLATLDFPSQRGWKTFAVPTGGQPDGDEERFGRLSFRVWTKNNHSRHFVIDGQMNRIRPPGSQTPGQGSKSRSRRGVDGEGTGAGDPRDAGDNDVDAGDESEEGAGR